MAKKYVYSTLSASVRYPTDQGEILVKGGANIADKHMLTPYGVVTTLEEHQADSLMGSAAFLDHVSAGFITVEDHKEDPDLVAANMTGRDGAAPDTAESLMLEDDTIESVEGSVVKRKAK